jgi:hypothetical protein
VSDLREQLIREGKLVPLETVKAIERVSKQLYNVAKRTEDGQDSVPPEDLLWEEADNDVQEVFRAMARYVLSTYTENDRLRGQRLRVKQAARRFLDAIPAEHYPGHEDSDARDALEEAIK